MPSSSAQPATCPRCGAQLARDNASGRCAPCQAAERDRLTKPPTLPESFWDHEPIRRAAAERHFGRLIRAYRNHPYHGRHPLPQETVGRWLGITQAQMSRVENRRPIVHLDRLIHWAQILGIPGHLLWFTLPHDDRLPRAQGPAPSGQTRKWTARATPKPNEPLSDVTLPADLDKSCVDTATLSTYVDGGSDDMNRRQFTMMAAMASIGVVGPVREALASTEIPRNVALEHVELARSFVKQLRTTDAAVGAEALCDVAIDVYGRLATWVARSSYTRAVGEALQSALADLANQIGWLCIDAERRPTARHYLNEAITRARVADDPQEEVRALCTLALLTREIQPHESLQCADAARRVSAGWATPRLNTLLHLRSALAYANLQDVGGFNREMAKARREFDRGTHEDDLPFLTFVTIQELNSAEGLSYLALNHPDRAAAMFQTIVASPDTAHRRNQINRTLLLAEATNKEGDTAEAARIAMTVLPEMQDLRSRRTRDRFVALRADLSHHQAVPAVRDFIDAYAETFTAAR